MVAIFKNHEMTFIPFILALIRLNINYKDRKWQNNTDNFSPIDVGYISQSSAKKEKNIDFESKMDKIKDIDSQLDKL